MRLQKRNNTATQEKVENIRLAIKHETITPSFIFGSSGSPSSSFQGSLFIMMNNIMQKVINTPIKYIRNISIITGKPIISFLVSQETTVKLSANSSGASEASSNISVKASEPATLKSLTATPSKRYCYINEYIPVTYTATYTDGSTKTLSYSDISWDCFYFERGESPTDDEQAEVRYCNLTPSGFVTSNAESGSLYNLAGGLTGSSYSVYVQVKYTEGGKTVGGYLDMTIHVEAIDLEVSASGTDLFKSKPSQSIYFYPKFKLRTGDGSSVYFRDASEAKELVERYGDYGFNLRGSDVPSWVITVDDCLSADFYYREAIDLFVRYPGITIKYKTVTYYPD